MKKTVLYIVLLLLGVALVDVFFRWICYNTFQHPYEYAGLKGGSNKYFYYDKPSDIVVLGASRAEYHYQTKMIEDSLGISSYNYGGSGASMIQQYLSLLNAYKNGTVKLVILDLTTGQLSNKWVKDRISTYYPFYWANDTVRSLVKQVEGSYMDLLMGSSLIQYNSELINVLSYILKRDNRVHDVNGYSSLKYIGEKIVVSEKDIAHEKISNNGGYNMVALNCFKRIVDLCIENNTNLVVCLSPSLVLEKDDREALKKIVTTESVEFWDYTDFISDNILFSDASHLNEKGSTIFTNEIIREVREQFNY